MPDVTVVGGGLSGLAAAYTLEQHDIDYSLIEVKRQTGGSLRSVQKQGFVMDGGAFALLDNFDRDWLANIGLADALISLDDNRVAFAGGTQSLVDALTEHLTAPRMMRMAVSSIGDLENGKFALCLENGLMLDANALILAVPARYAERMFYAYLPDVAQTLLDYRYDTVQRVSMGYTSATVPPLEAPADMAHVFTQRTQHPARTPDGGTLLHIGLRPDSDTLDNPEKSVNVLHDWFNLPAPDVFHVGYHPEADPITCYDDAHQERIRLIRDALSPRLALIGSDYTLSPISEPGLADLADRITQGQQAAQQIIEHL